MDIEIQLQQLHDAKNAICLAAQKLGLDMESEIVVERFDDGPYQDGRAVIIEEPVLLLVNKGKYVIQEECSAEDKPQNRWIVERAESIPATRVTPPDMYYVTVGSSYDIFQCVKIIFRDMVECAADEAVSLMDLWLEYIEGGNFKW